MKTDWIVAENGFDKDKIEFWGSKFCIGNGYYGYRGTLEEYAKEQLTACTLSEIYDDSGSGWREPINLQNPLRTTVYYQGKPLSVLTTPVKSHTQRLDIKTAVHSRETVFVTEGGKEITVKAERFASIEHPHLLAMRYTVSSSHETELTLRTEIDCDVWDINGPHFSVTECSEQNGICTVASSTIQNNRKLAVSEVTVSQQNANWKVGEKELVRTTVFTLNPGQCFTAEKYISICKDSNCENPAKQSAQECKKFAILGYDMLLQGHATLWQERWNRFDVQIDGDQRALTALRYSTYLLLICSPFHTDRVAIPARGLSGQVYKGAMFWDTEMYMLHPFLYCCPHVAKNLMMYRVHNLQKAREKAREYGYRGAFYPWESQETGEDGCTHYNLVDIFTRRPMRTYFRDKQIHISADVVYGLCAYLRVTGDRSILKEGGAEMILECARFFYSYSYFKTEKNRYELLDVTCADEYHERVNNNAYTNYMVKLTLEAAVDLFDNTNPNELTLLLDKLDYHKDVQHIRDMNRLLYLPQPNKDGIIEQFDGYFKNESITLEELYSRIIKPNEYLGSPCGLAVHTQIIKQADVVLLLTALKERFPDAVKQSNWQYYEPRTEHGSSLSTCVYALLAAQLGKTDWAYRYFLKAAELDLLGNYKLYLGDLYIGGTHPAANSGSWMVAVLGFGGLSVSDDIIKLTPHLPKGWNSLSFYFTAHGNGYRVVICPNEVTVTADSKNKTAGRFIINNNEYICGKQQNITVKQTKTEGRHEEV